MSSSDLPPNSLAPKIGQTVRLKGLNGKTGLVLAISPSGTYSVAVGNLTVSCKLKDLAPATPAKDQSQKSSNSGTGKRSTSTPLPPLRKHPSVDLHGKTVNEGLELLEQAISSAILAGAERLEVVHGIGTGALSRAIHRHLPTLKVVKSFKIDQLNPGMTTVYL